MNCSCISPQAEARSVADRLAAVERELVEAARRMLRSASDPVSAVIRFLHERPDGALLPGDLIKRVLLQAFGTRDEIPGLVAILSGHVKEIARHSNVIRIVNEHSAVSRWGSYLIKQADRIKFEVARERGWVVLKNITGLVAVEHGIELGLDRIRVVPPKLEVTLRLGSLRPRRLVDID